ncbi:equilibrative nucleoside transporter, putative, partial [Perkinsus marinus ATCC 50983]
VIPMFRLCMVKHPYMRDILKIEESRKKEGFTKRQSTRPVYAILKDIMLPAFIVWSVLTITFTVFPSQVTQFTSSKGPDDSVNFIPLVTYMYQIFDTVGRFAPNMGIRLSPLWLVVVSLGRAIFIPLFICIRVFPSVIPFYYNWFKHVMMAIFAFSNGVVATLGMMLGPKKVPNHKDEQEIAGYAMGFCLINGILIGSIFGVWITDML